MTVQETKVFQGYTKDRQCNKCANYKSEIVNMGRYEAEKNKRCGIGGFAVQSSASCDLFEKK